MVVAMAAGCSSGGDGEPVTRPSASASGPTGTPSVPPVTPTNPPPSAGTDLPTFGPPTGPPSQPTDQIKTGYLTGTVTKGGKGPCYGLEADDGRVYALYSTAGENLARGERVRVRVEPLRLKVYCGPGPHLSMLTVARVR